jgi:5'-3' exonuclease
VGAIRGLLHTLIALLSEDGVTHVACAFDHVIESFRNDLYPGYKTGDGVPRELMAQFPLAERAARALGVVVWPMVEFEADDAMAAAAARWADVDGVEQVVLCTPDKDLAQCVRGTRVVQVERRTGVVRDETLVAEKFGVPPASIPDWLALVGDSADGYPGLPGWGAKSAAKVLAHWRHIDRIPEFERDWQLALRGASGLAATLRSSRETALLFRTLATLRTDVPVFDDVEEIRWTGPRDDFADVMEEIGAPGLVERAERAARARA